MATGNFFIIDRRTWASVCQLGMGPALAYLVLACGTQKNNRDTDWSVNAVSKYGGIGIDRAKRYIRELRDAQFLDQTQGGTRPHYILNSWFGVLQTQAVALKSKHVLGKLERRIYEGVCKGSQPKTYREQRIAEGLAANGWLYRAKQAFVSALPEIDPEDISNKIWLPNALVTGTTAGEGSPIARVRGYQDVMVLRLLVDLYHDQNLRDDGGISRTVLWQEWERIQVGEQGVYKVWAFKKGHVSAIWSGASECHRKLGDKPGADFWLRLEVLEQEGLVTFVPHLCESKNPNSEVIHAYGKEWSPEGLQDPENAVGQAAYYAGCAMANEAEWTKHLGDGYSLFAPVSRSYPEVQLVGIARLRYRPHTKMTGAWFRELRCNLPVHIEQYNKLRHKGDEARSRAVGA